MQGGLAGVTGWTVVFPFDTIKSVVQTGVLPGTALCPPGPGPATLAPPTMLIALRAVVRHGGGMRGLYRGWSAAVFRAFPANAALLWGVHTAEAALDSITAFV
jgi:hypothetical protein